jgi:hypothetical protein
MRHIALAAFVAVTIVAFPASAAAQADHHANSKKAEFHLSSPMLVGNIVLDVGDYQFQCVRIDGVDFLVVTAVEDGKAMARVPCTPEALSEAPKVNDMRTVPTADGGRVLTAVRIRGDKVAHRVDGH